MARGVFLGRRWSRGPAVATQLILLPIAWSFRGGVTTGISVALALLAIAALIGLLHPRSTAVFVGPALAGPLITQRALFANHLQRMDQLLVVCRLRLGLLLDPAEE